MNKANRAAQFNPFDSLKGLQEALREKEEKLSRVEKRDLSEEQEEALSRALQRAEKGDTVCVTFYRGGHYYTVTDTLTAINRTYRFLTVGEAKIYFDDLYAVKTL